jgi:hypothetical protein
MIDPLDMLKAPNSRSHATGLEYLHEARTQGLFENPAKLHAI